MRNYTLIILFTIFALLGVQNSFALDTTIPTTTGTGTGSGSGTPISSLNPQTDYLQALNQVCGTSVIETTSATGTGTGGTTQELKFISVIVSCFQTVIEGVAMDAMAKVSEGLTDAVNAAMLFYVMLFGMRLISGQINQPRSELIMHGIKLGVVSWLVNNAGLYELWDLTLSAYQDLLQVMLAPATLTSCPGSFTSLDQVWSTMDCLFAKITGFNAQNGYGSSWQGVVLLFSMIVSKATESGGAYMLSAFIANALLTIIFSFLQIALAYIISMLGLTLLFAIAPLMMPLMFFRQTQNYFDAWWRMIFSFILQVGILFAFTSFAFGIMDQIYSGGADGSSGLQQLFSSTKISNEVTRTDTLGSNTMYWQKSTAMFSDAMSGKGDMSMVVNFVSLLVLGYLMLSFIGVVGQIAQEISGQGAFPNLMGLSGQSLRVPRM